MKKLFTSTSDVSNSELFPSESPDDETSTNRQAERIHVEIVEVLGLHPQHDIFIWPNIYVSVAVEGKTIFRTKTRPHALNHLFYESFQIAFNPSHIMTFQVYVDKRMTVDDSLGIIAIPMGDIVLKEGESRFKTFPVAGPGQYSRLTVKFTSKGFSQADEDTVKRETQLDATFKSKKADDLRKVIENKRSKQTSTKEFYRVLGEIGKKGTDNQVMLKQLKLLEKEVLIAIERWKKNDNVFTKSIQYIRGMKDLFKDHRGTEDGDVITLIENLGVPLIECLGEVIACQGQTLSKLQKQDEAYDVMRKFEIDYYQNDTIAHELDVIDALRLKNEKYAFLHGYRIHFPHQYKATAWPKSLHREIPAAFFSWVAYEHRPRWTFGSVWDETVDARLKGYGKWTIVNQIDCEDLGNNFHCIFVMNPELDQVVIAFRGTEYSRDDRRLEGLMGWMSNFDVIPVEFPIGDGIRVHKGFLDQYLSCKDELIEQASIYLKKGFKILITGHSAGAALATLLALHLGVFFGSMATQKIDVMTFGSPRIGNPEFAKAFDKIYPNMKRFVTRIEENLINVVDLVTTAPYESFGYKHVGNEVFLKGNRNYYGNSNPIPGVSFSIGITKIDSVMLHVQQCYMDGVVDFIRKSSKIVNLVSTEKVVVVKNEKRK